MLTPGKRSKVAPRLGEAVFFYVRCFSTNFCTFPALGAILGPFWGHLGAILAPSWRPRGHLGVFWRRLGAFWTHLGTIVGPFQAIMGPFGPILGSLEAILGPSWGVLEPSWGLLEASWGHLWERPEPTPIQTETSLECL